MKHLTTIPFCGFYDSIHSSELDRGLEQMFSDHDTGCDVNRDLVQRAYDLVDWRLVHTKYAKEYCENLAERLEIKLEFDELNSPKFYNFTTDRIFAYISTADLMALRKRVDSATLEKEVKQRFTSRDGFSSFYSNKLVEWPWSPKEWDHNQIGTLLEAVVEDEHGGWDQWKEYDLMAGSFCNGFIDNILSPGLERLLNVHDYLETRKSREYA